MTFNCTKSKLFFPLICITVVSALTGCVTREKPVLSLSAKQSMNTAKLVLVNDHAKLDAAIEGSNATQVMGGGLLWALADAAAKAEQRNSQSKLLAPINDKLIIENLLVNLKEKIKNVTGDSAKFQFNGDEINGDKIGSYISLNSQQIDSIGILTPKYQFTEDFSALKTSIAVKFIPTSKSFKTALGVSEAYEDSVIDTVIQHVVTPNNTVAALNNNSALKKKAKDSVQNVVLLNPEDARAKIKEAFNRLRVKTKKHNAEIWFANNGKEVNKAIIESTLSVIKKLQVTLPIMFPDGINKVQPPQVKALN